MWGALTSSRTLCGYELRSVLVGGGLCRYQRVNGRGEVEASTLAPCSSIEVWPLTPIFYPERITSYVMVRLEEPITVTGGGSVTLTLHVGFDVGVMVDEQVIDVFPSTATCKYALYGSPTRGILARYLRAGLAMDSGDSDGDGLCMATLRVEILNRFTRPVTIGKIVFPVSPSRLALIDGAPSYPSVRMVVTSSYTAVVSVLTLNSERLRAMQRGASFVMSYGF
jgi:hypothetical protein